MGKSCILIPTVKVGNKEIESRLFKDLLSFTKNDRGTTKVIWGLSQLDSIKNTEGIVLDSNGEPTIDSIKKVFNLKDIALYGVSQNQESTRVIKDTKIDEKGELLDSQVFGFYKKQKQVVLNEKESNDFNNYLSRSRGVLPKNFFIYNSKILLNKSNNNKRSSLYNIIDVSTGEILKEKVPIFTQDQYLKIKKSSKNKDIHSGTKQYYPKKTAAFSLNRQLPSKSNYIHRAKAYLHEAISNTFNVVENSINFKLIDDYVNSLPDALWEYVSTSTVDYNNPNINASTSPKNELTIDMPKLGLIREAERLSGIKLEGEKINHKYKFKWRNYNEEMTLQSEGYSRIEVTYMIEEVLKKKGYFPSITEKDSINMYAEDHNMTVKEVLDYMKENTEQFDDMTASNTNANIKKYDNRFRKFTDKINIKFESEIKDYITKRFSDKFTSTGISYIAQFFSGNNWIDIAFNTSSGNYKSFENEELEREEEVKLRYAAILHEPFHAMHALIYGSKEELAIRDAYMKFIETPEGQSIYNEAKNTLTLGNNNDTSIYKEICAYTWQLMHTPKQLRDMMPTTLLSSKIYNIIKEALEKPETYEYIKSYNSKTETTEVNKKVDVKLNFLHKLWNGAVSSLNRLIPISSKFIKMFNTYKLVDFNIENEVINYEYNTKTIDKAVEQKYAFNSALNDFIKTMESVKTLESSSFNPANIYQFFDKSSNYQERGKGNKFIFPIETSIAEAKKELKAVDSKGNDIVYKEVSDVINSVIEFNKNTVNITANVNTSSNGFTIDVSPSNIEAQSRATELVFNNELNNRLLGKLRSVGLDVRVNESLEHNGLFNPLNAEKTAEDTYTVIEIAKGERGEAAFPEEFSHAIIEGLSKNPLVDRLISTVNDQSFLREYLGDKYESYKSMYNNNNTLMAKEVAGKLLAESIKEGNTSKNNLIERLWNIAKNLLSKLNKNDFDSIYKESRRIADGINKSIEDNSFTSIFNINDVFSAKPLASIASEVSKIQELAERSLTLYSKRMDILRRRSKNGEYREEDMEVVKNINKLYDKKNYVSSISAFLTSTLDQIETMHKVLINTDTSFSGDNKFIQINKASKNLRMIKEFNDAYSDIIKELMAIETYAANGDVEILESDAKNIAEQASSIFKVINNINVTYNKARFNTVYSFLSEFWGGDSIKTFGKDAGKILTLESMLSGAERDVNFIDRFISSMGSSSDPLSNLLYKVVKQTQNKRDSMLSELVDEMRVINDKLIKAGYSSDFMYERDSNGTPTMKIISNVDHAKYISDRAFYLESLRNKYDDYFKVSTEMQKWENKHNIKIVVNKESGRTATIPNPALYPSDAYSKLDTIQKEYYDKMMQYKGLLDSLIPFGESRIYDTVNITNDLTEGIINNINNPSKLTNTILSDIRDKFVRRNSDVEASRGMSNNKEVLLDFTGKPINTLPIYYTQKLDDADRLSTDFTGSLIAYAGMAINYNEMSKIIDALELTRDLMREREVQQLSGDDKIVEAFTVMNRKFANEFKDKGSSTNIMKAVDDFYNSKIYNQTKIDEGSFTIPILEVEIDKAKTLDTLKSYTGLLGLGLNAFSGISNILAGDTQLLIESGANKYFGVKNLLKAKVQYFNLLAPFLGELNSTKKSSLMYLLGKQFDVTEDFMSSLKEENYNKSAIGRILGKTNVYILNSLGEHYLHYQTLFAMLDNTKIKLNGKTTTLFNAFEVKDVTNNGDLIATKLVIKEGATLENGDKITEEYLEQIKNTVNTVNKSMNGGFSELDKGAINRYALGRLAMQFRQWMPEHYNRRLAGAYYDNMLGEWREGYYRTLGRFSLNLIQDLRRAKFEFATRYKELSSTEKENLRRTFTEIGIFASLALFISMMGPAKDKKGSWYDRMIIYQAKRLQLEVGASIPFLPQFIENNWQIIQSPSASIKTINNITDLLMFHNMFNEIKSGRYKGYSKYEKDIIDLTPIYGQLNKLKDITEEDYMFTIFNDKN